MNIPDDCTVRLVDLPVDCGGMVSLSPDGHYNVFLNARLNNATQRKKLKHEISHIENDDFFNDCDIRTIEARATPRHPLPPLMKARDLLPHSKSLPPLGKVAQPQAVTDEVPRSPVTLSPHQAAVLLSAISDLDSWLFRDTSYDL